MTDTPAFQPTRRLAGAEWREAGDASQEIEREAPEEVAIGLAYDSRPYVVLMASPSDVADLATGFTITEKIAAFADIAGVTVSAVDEGLLADVLLAPRASDAMLTARRRTMEARSSCGLCGVESLREAIRPIAPVTGAVRVTHAAIQRALAELEDGQALGRRTRATHAAAWADPAGALTLVREDVGRHNALDKLVGAAAAAGLDPAAAFIVITSRCSYEMVEKTAAAGVATLVAISAPTALAVRKAEAASLTLVALARRDGHTVFAGALHET